MSQVHPLADRIVAEPLEASEKTASGLYLPADAKEKPQMARVIAVGKDVKEVKKGDVIAHKSYVDEIDIDGKKYIIVKEEDALAIVK